MEIELFLNRPQKCIKIVSWNINAVRTKMEKVFVMEMLQNFDIVSLNEIKTPRHVPGYVSYVSRDTNNPHRGGTCVLIKQHLNQFVREVDTSIVDQVWFKLTCVTGVLFGCCYVLPPDSPFFSHVSFSSVQAKLKTSEHHNGCIVIGDFNACFGNTVRDLPVCVEMQHLSYPVIPDPVRVANDNASALFGICAEEKMVILNNMKIPQYHFPSALTYRQGSQWTSELDVCGASTDILNCITNFSVNNDPALPSDHAPIFLTECVICRFELLLS